MSYVTLSGLWAKDTKRGQVLSAKLTAVTKAKILAALSEPGDGELVIFTSDKRDSETSPTHTLCLSRKDG